MSTLFVTATWPHPLDKFEHGVSRRMRLFLRALDALGEPLDMLVFAPWNEPPAHGVADEIGAALRARWGLRRLRHVHVRPSRVVADRNDSLWHGYLKPALSMRLQPKYARVWGPEISAALAEAVRVGGTRRVFAHKLQAMGALQHLPGPWPPVALDLDDVEHRALARLLHLPPVWGAKRLRQAWVPALARGERRALQQATVSFVCSELDRADLQQRWGIRSARVVPNALPVPPQTTPLPDDDTALFLGSLFYEPNRLGADFLMREVWPRVRAAHPRARLLIAGPGGSHVQATAQQTPGVELLGFVDDLAALYARTQVVCSPIFSGGGTRVKIIEAALFGRPVVSTALGAEGLAFDPRDGNIALAEDPAGFAQAIGRLFTDGAAAARMGAAARERAGALYAEPGVLDTIARHFSESGWLR